MQIMNKIRNFSRYFLFFTIALLMAGTSCKSRKNPSLSENALISEIQVQEGQIAENDKEAQKMRDSLSRLPRGFRYKEIRSVDPGRPPVVLHFTDSLPQEGIPFMWCSGREFKKQSVSKRISGLADNDAVIILAK